MSGSYTPYGGPQGGYGYTPQGGPERGYLQGAPVDFQSAIKLQLDNVLNFNGRASRSAYWWYALALAIVNIVVSIVANVIGVLALTLLLDLVSLVIGLSGLSVGVRRLHDANMTGWLLLLGFIPILGWIAVIVLLVLPSTPGPNRFG